MIEVITTQFRKDDKGKLYSTCPLCSTESKIRNTPFYKFTCRVCGLYELEDVLVSFRPSDDSETPDVMEPITEAWERIGFSRFMYKNWGDFTWEDLAGVRGNESRSREGIVTRNCFILEGRAMARHADSVRTWCLSIKANNRSQTHLLAFADWLQEIGAPMMSEVTRLSSKTVSQRGIGNEISDFFKAKGY